MAQLIAEWNRTDLSQFVSGSVPDFNHGSPAGDPGLSVVAVAERGNVLRYTRNLGGGDGDTVTQIWMFTEASGFLIPSADERRDIDIEIEAYTATPYFGAFVLGDLDTPLHGFGACEMGLAANNGWQTLLDNGTPRRVATSVSTNAEFFASIKIRARKPAGAPPEVTETFRGWNNTGEEGHPRRSGSTLTARGLVTPQFGENTTLGATWNDISANRMGLCVISGVLSPTTIDIISFRAIDPWA